MIPLLSIYFSTPASTPDKIIQAAIKNRPPLPPSKSKGRAQLKADCTRWRTGGEVKGKQASGVGSQ